mmetsp:Transcript_16786/g.32709  ORF Transcript_16786/g.32709 Transcript_16786/m.32709 type:complete len:227 (+) Transcript_16786:782-1462(+)
MLHDTKVNIRRQFVSEGVSLINSNLKLVINCKLEQGRGHEGLALSATVAFAVGVRSRFVHFKLRKQGKLPKVGNGRCISPGVLAVHGQIGILVGNEVDGLVIPCARVLAECVERLLGETGELHILEVENECCLFDGVETLAVDAVRKVKLTHFSPTGTRTTGEGRNVASRTGVFRGGSLLGSVDGLLERSSGGRVAKAAALLLAELIHDDEILKRLDSVATTQAIE